MGGRLFEQRNSLHNKSRNHKDINNRGITIATLAGRQAGRQEVVDDDEEEGGIAGDVSSGVIEIVFL